MVIVMADLPNGPASSGPIRPQAPMAASSSSSDTSRIVAILASSIPVLFGIVTVVALAVVYWRTLRNRGLKRSAVDEEATPEQQAPPYSAPRYPPAVASMMGYPTFSFLSRAPARPPASSPDITSASAAGEVPPPMYSVEWSVEEPRDGQNKPA